MPPAVKETFAALRSRHEGPSREHVRGQVQTRFRAACWVSVDAPANRQMRTQPPRPPELRSRSGEARSGCKAKERNAQRDQLACGERLNTYHNHIMIIIAFAMPPSDAPHLDTTPARSSSPDSSMPLERPECRSDGPRKRLSIWLETNAQISFPPVAELRRDQKQAGAWILLLSPRNTGRR